MIAQPPVPMRCAGRPTLGGLVIPWITLHAGGRYLFGALDRDRRDLALAERRYQVYGQSFDERICLAVRVRRRAWLASGVPRVQRARLSDVDPPSARVF